MQRNKKISNSLIWLFSITFFFPEKINTTTRWQISEFSLYFFLLELFLETKCPESAQDQFLALGSGVTLGSTLGTTACSAVNPALGHRQSKPLCPCFLCLYLSSLLLLTAGKRLEEKSLGLLHRMTQWVEDVSRCSE